MADLPPVDFVPRPAELAALRSKLLDPTTGEAVAITAALDGAGVYGKTPLARAVCQDEAVVDAYHDGILWVPVPLREVRRGRADAAWTSSWGIGADGSKVVLERR